MKILETLNNLISHQVDMMKAHTEDGRDVNSQHIKQFKRIAFEWSMLICNLTTVCKEFNAQVLCG